VISDAEQFVLNQFRSAVLLERIRDRNRIKAEFRVNAQGNTVYVTLTVLDEIVDPDGLTVVPDAVVDPG
jgi:hypothetical protein